MKFEDALAAMRRGKSPTCGRDDDYWCRYNGILHHNDSNDYDTLGDDVDGLRESLGLLDERQTRLAWRMGDLEERVTALEENIAGLGDSCLIRDLRKEDTALAARISALVAMYVPTAAHYMRSGLIVPDIILPGTAPPPLQQQGPVCKTE